MENYCRLVQALAADVDINSDMIPGFIIAWLTFPGVIVHEWAHKVFCHCTGTRVLEVCYFRLGNPAGYVTHEPPASVWKHILIGIGPLYVNTAIGLTLGLLAAPLKYKDDWELAHVGLLYLAVSIAMHSFPSAGDAKNIWNAIWDQNAPTLTRIVGAPLVALIMIGAIGSFFWLDLLYGIGVVIGLPSLLRS